MTISDSYRKIYRLRFVAGNKVKAFEITFPYQVVDKEARKRGLTIEEFISAYRVVAQYNGFEGVLYTFELAQNGDNNVRA